MRGRLAALGAALALVALLAGSGCGEQGEPAAAVPAGKLAPAPTPPVPCARRDPLRQVYFGDLHVHTARSMDAFTGETRTTPDEAYRFAKGGQIGLPPLDEEGRGTRLVRLERPLDFAAVTDHAEYFGEVELCTDPDSAVYSTRNCVGFRGDPADADSLDRIVMRMAALMGQDARQVALNLDVTRPAAVCGQDGARCAGAASRVWREMQEAAERHQGRAPACDFTTFIAYEWTLTPKLTKIHRNVIFRGREVPPLPITSIEEPTPQGLWRRLRSECLDAGSGCDVLAIPHNPNLSNGHMFAVEYPGATTPEEQAAQARLRARMEPLVEIMQVKGDSECRNGMSGIAAAPDELCDFEKWRGPDAEDCGDGTGEGALGGRGCISRLDFVRNVLVEGLREADRIGVNPYKLGIIASTDTHNGTPGDVEEYSFDGASGLRDSTTRKRLEKAVDVVAIPDVVKNPGGLVAVWAEENTREAIFQALRRRETYGTSGPRMGVRFFGGWSYDGSLCDAPDFAARGYAGGVPMGSDLPPRSGDATVPTFAVSALRDPGTVDEPGGRLQRIQIVKGWVGEDGLLHEAVYDVAGRVDDAASVDPETCAPQGPGADSLCAVWRDEDFDPRRRSVYYARVLENPSCRYSARQCLDLPDFSRPASCDDGSVPKLVQERAWTSPIWYEEVRS